MRLEIEVSGDERAGSRFTQLVARLNDPQPALQTDVADYLRRRQLRRIASRGDGSWRPNRPSTIGKKGNNRPGFDSGRLVRSMTRRKAAGSVARPEGRQTLRFGTSLFYARFFARERALFDSTQADARAVGSLLLRYLVSE